MTFKVGDRVVAVKNLHDYPYSQSEGIKRVIPEGTVGTVRYANLEWMFEYDILFDGESEVFYGASHELALYQEPVPDTRSRWQRFLDRWFPKYAAEEKFGTNETITAFNKVQKNGTKVTIEGK